MDGGPSTHDWTEGRGEEMVLVQMIDDATSRVMARFHPSDTVEAHLDLLGRWLTTHGRPVALYTDESVPLPGPSSQKVLPVE